MFRKSRSVGGVTLVWLLQMVTSVTCMTYSCYPNGTIIVDNPVPANYTHAIAVDYELIGADTHSVPSFTCDLDWNTAKTKITIGLSPGGFCSRGRDIQLTLSSTPLSEEYIIKDKDMQHYMVRCSEIPATGVTVNVRQEFNPELLTLAMSPDVELQEIMPMMNGSVNSAMRACCDYKNNPPISSAEVGVHIHWTLDIYHEYYLYPISCIAYSGQDVTGSPSVYLYSQGCSSDKHLTDYNTTDVFDNRRMYVMDFFVFHFYNSNYITIDCNIQVCPPNSSELCDWGDGCERRRRGLSPPHDGRRARSDIDGATGAPMFTKARTTLRVLPGKQSAGTSMDYSPLWELLAAAGVLVVVVTALLWVLKRRYSCSYC